MVAGVHRTTANAAGIVYDKPLRRRTTQRGQRLQHACTQHTCTWQRDAAERGGDNCGGAGDVARTINDSEAMGPKSVTVPALSMKPQGVVLREVVRGADDAAVGVGIKAGTSPYPGRLLMPLGVGTSERPGSLPLGRWMSLRPRTGRECVGRREACDSPRGDSKINECVRLGQADGGEHQWKRDRNTTGRG